MPPKRRRRFQGLYYHSSPPKVLPMNGQISNLNSQRRRDQDDLSVKLSTIRIWMHEKDIGKLTRLLWTGQGNRLRQQASTNPKVKRFLTAVPYVMNSVKDVHQAVIDNNLETLQAHLEPPVPPALVTCRDANGLNLIHKAAGLGHATILEYLTKTWPDGVHETDITGKTPLHWAASAKNNMRCYTLLTQAGCDEEAVDYKMKTPSFYRHKPHEIERSFLTYVPEAPRVSPDVPTDWEALSDDAGDGKKLDIKIPEMNGFGRHSNGESNENTSEAEMIETGHEDEEMSKDEEAPAELAEQNGEGNEEEMNEEEPEVKDEPEENEAEEEANEDKEEPTDDKEDETEEQKEETAEDQEANEDEKPEEKKQQTETLNETSANLTKATQDDNDDDKNETDKEKDHKENNDHENEQHSKENSDHDAEAESINENGNSKTDDHETDKEKELVSEENNSEEKTDLDNFSEAEGSKKESKQEKTDEATAEEVDEKEKSEEAKTDESGEQEEKVDEVESGNSEANKDDNASGQDQVNDPENKNDPAEEIKPDDGNVIDNKEKTSEENVTEDKEKTSEENETTKESQDQENELSKEDDKKEEGEKEDKEQENGEKENDDSKTIGEALVDIKNEVKDNVKYLASNIKNVFSNKNDQKDKDDESKENQENDSEKENEVTKETETNDNKEEGKNNKEAENKEGDKTSTENEEDETKNEAEESKDKENDQEQSSSKDETNTTAGQSPLKATPKKANDKTEEDENNNDNNQRDTNKTETDAPNESTNSETITDDQFKALNESLEAYSKAGDELENKVNEVGNGLEKKVNEVGDKLENKVNEVGKMLNGVADDIEDHVKETADNVKLALETATKTEHESSDVVVHGETSLIQRLSKRIVEGDVSSDETGDEDEEPEANGENEEQDEANNEMAEENEEHNETEAKNDDGENPELNQDQETEKEAEEPEPEANAEEANSPNDEKLETNDENKNDEENPEDEEKDGEGSLTSSLAIEGFVQGEAEDNTVQSQTAAYVQDDEETHIQNVIASGDMEQLAQIVLNGDGRKLMNVEATEPEIQAFLKNVPNYMNKIRRVHEAARSGSLLNLQQSLDRRKFAIAKDEISPEGATPLHVAVLFGNSDIVRYLAARFSETMTTTDNDDRTALHYAAVINDNGHFYNVLLQLGANPKDTDKLGHTPEDYLGKEELKATLNYAELLKRFGAEEIQDKLLSDQGELENQSSQENPIFKTEQGKYLADNLADPLIKALTQVAHKRPTDPLQYLTNYLQTYASSRNTNGRTITQAAVHSGSSQTNSTIFASSKPSTSRITQIQPAPIGRMNGHINYSNADDIVEDNIQQIEEIDEGSDSEAAMSKKLEERDEHGQSMLHFACARSHRRGGLIHLIEEAKSDITYRDELYRTARDVALQANQLGNAKEIDRYVMSLAIVGDLKPFEHFAVSGYDHIIDITDENETPIIDVLEAKGLYDLARYLKTIRPLEELREELHQMIRGNNIERVKEIADSPDGNWLIRARNYYGRTALHIALLKESVEIVEYFVNICPEALKVGDNLERTPLHYAMGTNIVEGVSHILIQNGAKRTYKDLKGRQPSYYFINKADILRLQEEEDENR